MRHLKTSMACQNKGCSYNIHILCPLISKCKMVWKKWCKQQHLVKMKHTLAYLPHFSILKRQDIVVGCAAALVKRYRTHRWRKRGFWTPLPSVHLTNLHSLPNKTDKLLLLSRTNKDFSNPTGNLAEWRNTGQRTPSAELPTDQIRPRCRINREIMRRWDVLLHQWKVVYRCNCVKEDVLFWVLFKARCLPHISPIIILTSCDWLLFIYLYKQLFLCSFLYSFVLA